jgi:tellurite resistance protein
MWLLAAATIGASPVIGDAIAFIACAVWCVLAAGYLSQGPRQIAVDARDTVNGSLLAAPIMTGLVLGTILSRHARTAGHVVVIVCLVLGALLCGLLIGRWMTGGLDENRIAPAMYLPGGGIGLVGSEAASGIGLDHVAAVFFGIGLFTWVFVSSIVLSRLMFRPHLDVPLVLTLAIELAPPAVAGSAYFLLHRGRPDLFAYGIAGYAVMAVVAQIALLPLYRATKFTAGFWSFTFQCAATATLGLRWLALEHPAGHQVYAWIVVALTTILVTAIAVRTLVEVTRWSRSHAPLRRSRTATRDA